MNIQIARQMGLPDALLSKRDVHAVTSLSSSTMKRLMGDGEFPKPVALGARRVGWSASDIGAWIAARTTAVPQTNNPFGRAGKPKPKVSARGSK